MNYEEYEPGLKGRTLSVHGMYFTEGSLQLQIDSPLLSKTKRKKLKKMFTEFCKKIEDAQFLGKIILKKKNKEKNNE